MIPAARARPRLPTGLLAALLLLGGHLVRDVFPQEGLAQTPIFQETAQATGLDFHRFIGATGEFFFPENVGSGVALFDYDDDGDLDVYFLQGALLDQNKSLSDSLFPALSDAPPHNKLFRNELSVGGRLRFTDVTEEAGVGDTGYGIGAAVGDYDNDGDLDLYVTNFGSNLLYRNNGDGTFTDVTLRAGVDDERLSAGAAFLDYDLDSDLDLFLTNYLDFTMKGHRTCSDAVGKLDYCDPGVYHPLPDVFFRNDGEGKFSDVTEAAGIGTSFGRGMGVVCADFNLDGWIDLYVANDGSANQLWMNQGNGTFQDLALYFGAAYNADGQVEAGMGVTAGDFDADGDEDVFVTHLDLETHTLYRNDGKAHFRDSTVELGLAAISRYTGFGTEWFDYDNDGDLDLFVANGAVLVVRSQRGEPYPYREPNQLYRNDGGSRFVEIPAAEAGPALDLSEVSRGTAFGDIDNDGDIDIVVINNNGPARLLLNQIGSRRHWLQVRLEGTRANWHGMGARVGVLREGQRPLWRRAHTDGSYLSANDGRVHFGLGPDPRLKAVVVEWPGAKSEVWNDVDADRIILLREGSGTGLRLEREELLPLPLPLPRD